MDDTSKAILHRIALRIESYTIVSVAMGFYFLVFGCEFTPTQMPYLVSSAFVAATAATVFHTIVRGRDMRAIVALIRRGGPDDLRKAKRRVVAYAGMNGRWAALRWIVGVLCALAGVAVTVGATPLQVAGGLAVILFTAPYSSLVAVLVSENELVPLLNGPELGPIVLETHEVRGLSEVARKVWMSMALLLMPAVVLGFLFVISTMHGATFEQPALHLTAILVLTGIATYFTINEASRGTRGSVDSLVKGMDAMAKGDLAHAFVPMHTTSELGFVSTSVARVRANLEALIADAKMLSQAALEGRFDARADAKKHQGDYRAIIEGVNATLEALIAPTRATTAALERIAKGDLSARVSADDFREDARRTVDAVNRALGAMLAPTEEAIRVLDAIAARDLRVRMAGKYEGGHARMKDAVNATAGALNDSLLQVAEAADQVSGAAGQIASSSQAVAAGASEQAASLEETSAALELMTAQTRATAESAAHARDVATEANASASSGAEAMARMLDAMAKIRQSAESTGQIIRDISDIAFQTNLLALNAAVESARAGDAGRGFAVVAEEVRSLAGRAKEAAVRTEQLIQQAIGLTAEGEGTARQASTRIGEIQQGVERVTKIVGDIAVSAREQAAGIGQVAKAVSEMDKVTQQNAASSEESSASAQELSSQSVELNAMVASFQLDGAAAAQPRGPRLVRS